MALPMDQRYKQIVTFKDFLGFKKIEFIKKRYRIDKILGEGSFGTVRKAYHLQAKIDCAIKFIAKSKIDNDGPQMRFLTSDTCFVDASRSE